MIITISYKRLAAGTLVMALLLGGWLPLVQNWLPKAHAFTQTYTTSGSWQAPAGVTTVMVEAWGGGGGGGGRTATGVSGGGGGGAYAAKTINITPLNTYAYTVGTGGAGGTADGPNAADTVWDDGSNIKAAGGKGGLGTTTKGLGGTVGNSVGTTLYRGGNGDDGAGTVGGGGGGGAGATANGNDASGQTAGGYQQDGGAGGAGGAASNGVAGNLYGGGGGGGARTTTNRTGGAGAAGALRITYSRTSTLSVQTGYYQGDGSSAHPITGLGFAPDLVLIKADTSAGVAAFKTRVMPDANMALVSAATDLTTSTLVLNADGFTIGNNGSVNNANVRYTWIAFAGSNCTSSGVFCVGQYTGNGLSGRSIPTGFQPDFTMVKRTTATAANFHSSLEPDNESLYPIATVRDQTGTLMQSTNSSGFTVGTTNNTASGVYNYFSFKSTAGVFAQGTYTGDGTDDRSIMGFGFKPNIALVKNITNATAASTNMLMETDQSYGDNTSILTGTAAAPNNVQALKADGIEVGTSVYTNNSGDSYYWMAFGGAPAPTATSGNHFTMTTGSYTGTGAVQSVTGLGFTPDLVIIKDDAGNYQVFRTSLMKGDLTFYLAAASAGFTASITSLDSNGFTLGTSSVSNTSGNTYRWQAFGGAWNPETKAGATDFAMGVYTGNSLDNRNITGLPWQPDMVTIKRNSTSLSSWRSSAMTGDSSGFFNGTAEAADYIQALNSDGFQIGTNAAVNTASNLHFWFAFKSGGGFTAGSYTGNATDNRNITGLGFQPNLVWVKRTTAVVGMNRSSAISGDSSQYFTNAVNVADRIQDLISDGFQVGGNQTETNTSAAVYRYMAWRNAPSAIVSVSVTSDGTVNYGTVNSGSTKSTLDLTDTQTALNDASGSEDFNIKTSAPAGWSLGSSANLNTYVHEFSSNGGTSWTKFATADSYQSLVTNILANVSQNFDLRLTAPTYSSDTSQKTITVTIQAVQH